MRLYIGNLPRQTTAYDLRRLFGHALQGQSFLVIFRRYNMATRQTFRIVEQAGPEGVSRYGYAEIEPDSAAQLCIERLHGLTLEGQALIVRELLPRSYMNERRAVRWRDRFWPHSERRGTERRL